MHPAYQILGTTDEGDGCDACGRPDLTVYVALRPLGGGSPILVGTDCAARLTSQPSATVRSEARSADRSAATARRAEQAAASQAKTTAWLEWLTATAGPGEPADQIARLGGYAAAKARYRSA